MRLIPGSIIVVANSLFITGAGTGQETGKKKEPRKGRLEKQKAQERKQEEIIANSKV
jgi:hypothetical protein